MTDSSMNMEKCKTIMKELIKYYEQLINEEFILNDCIEHNEIHVGLETLCLELDSPDIILPKDIYQKLMSLCKFLDISEYYWKDIDYEK